MMNGLNQQAKKNLLQVLFHDFYRILLEKQGNRTIKETKKDNE